MAEIVAMAVSAAGSVAGGAAADALTKRNAPAGGGIPGLLTSTGARKDGSMDATQVDASKAIDYFKQAAQAQAAGYDTGLSYYLPQLVKSGKQIQAGYEAANTTLSPLSSASNQALNEQLRFMGLDPIQATANYGKTIRGVGSVLGDNLSKEVNAYGTTLADQLDAAASLKDPAERAAAKASIMSSMNNASTTVNADYQTQLEKIRAGQQDLAKQQAIATTNAQGMLEATKNLPQNSSSNPALAASAAAQKNAYENIPAMMQASKQAEASVLSKMEANNAALTSLRPFKEQFNQAYGDQYDAGYSADQIAEKVTQLPGYQFQYEQGARGLERKAAAGGMLQSANTQAALQEFGQQQAQSYYKDYMGQLSGVIQEGAPATAGIASNQVNLGNALGQISQMYGAAQMDTERAKADYLANSLMHSGDVFNNDAIFNAGQQNQAQQGELNREAEAKNTATKSGAGYISAASNSNYQSGMLGLAQQQFANSVQNSRNTAAGYLYGGR